MGISVLLVLSAIMSASYATGWVAKGFGIAPALVFALVMALVFLIVPLGSVVVVVTSIGAYLAAQKAYFRKVVEGQARVHRDRDEIESIFE